MRTAVIRRVTFNAAHRLFRADWSEERNREVFGLCSNPNYHGHNYTLFVRVTGDIDPETGYVLDLKVLKDIISEEVTGPFDHSNLNLDRPEFANLNQRLRILPGWPGKKDPQKTARPHGSADTPVRN